ncbi:MAG: glycine cleavage T C-terminal barrel domain-containing protein [Gemmatimonadales bacterium]
MTSLDEHRRLVDTAGALVMEGWGQFELAGADAGALVNRIATVDVSQLPPGRFAHGLLLRDDASILSLVAVYRFPDRVLLVVPPGQRVEAWQHLVDRKHGTVRLRDISDDVGLVIVRGPDAVNRLAIGMRPGPGDPGQVLTARLGGIDLFVARAPADGPDGVDIFCRVHDRVALMELLRSLAVLAVTEGPWQLLQMEWGMADVGHGIDAADTPIEAALEHLVAEGKGAPFPGEGALGARRRTGALKRLVGFRVAGARRPQVGAVVRVGGHAVDRVRAVSWSPRVGVIGLTAVPTSALAPGAMLSIEADGTAWPAEIVDRPFVSRAHPWGNGS